MSTPRGGVGGTLGSHSDRCGGCGAASIALAAGPEDACYILRQRNSHAFAAGSFVRDAELAWRTGVLFELEGTSVLVELLSKGDEIELRTRGPEAKVLLSVVAADLDALNDSFPGLSDKIDKRIPCICERCRVAVEPEFYSQRKLLERKEHGRQTVECTALPYHEIQILTVLDGIRVERVPAWGQTRGIKIFLASSSELRDERNEFDRYFREQNDRLLKQGIYLKIVRWENFLDAMSDTRLQDEYNRQVRACDIFVSLFSTKAGKFTQEEFQVARDQFQATGKPKVYTFFRDTYTTTLSAHRDDFVSLWAMQDKLKVLGHFFSTYKDIEHLKRQFRDQLDKLL